MSTPIGKNMKNISQLFFAFVLLITTHSVMAVTPDYIDFKRAKKLLNKVYHDHRITFYCEAEFDERGKIYLSKNFMTPKHEKRANRREWEHIVPAENFGRTFAEWRDGHPSCVDKKGKAFKGRKCAGINPEFSKMEGDMYNLVPAIGAVNAMRSNYDFTEINNAPYTFGDCPMIIQDKKVNPPEKTKGFIARTYFYFEMQYPRFRINSSMKKMMSVWDKQYPVNEWECKRAKRIEYFQKNPNIIVKTKCIEAGIWPQEVY